MAVAIRAVRRPQPPLVFVVPAVAALVLAHAWWASRYPLLELALALLVAVVVFPPLARGALVVMAFVGPTLNPPLLGIGPAGGGTAAGGRIYLVQAAILLVVLAALVWAALTGLHGRAALIVVASVLLVAVGTVGRPDAGAAWVYRPLQVFFVAFAVQSLFKDRGGNRLLLALAWGSAIGCALASVHALVPAFDPFAVSRPDNLPFISTIGSFRRATGAFTYPNNLGTFAGYTILLGAAALMLRRPVLPRPLAWFALSAGVPALLLSGSRAAGLGTLCGILYLTAKLAPRRRALILFAEGAIGLTLALAVLSAPSAAEVAAERIESAAGSSLTLRVGSWAESFDLFLASPLIGTGAAESRTDNFWLLYLAQGGIVGVALLAVLARASLKDGGGPKQGPELWTALVIALCVSGLLQDSLGQTLTTWFLGALLGVCMLKPGEPEAEEDQATRDGAMPSPTRVMPLGR